MDSIVETLDEGTLVCRLSATGNIAITHYSRDGVMGETIELSDMNTVSMIERLEYSLAQKWAFKNNQAETKTQKLFPSTSTNLSNNTAGFLSNMRS